MKRVSRNTLLVAFLRIAELVLQLLVFFMTYILIRIIFMQEQEPDMWKCMFLIGIPTFVLYVSRIMMKQGVILFVEHIVVAVGMLMQDDMIVQERIPYVVVGVILIVYSMSLCMNGQQLEAEHIPTGLISVFIVAVLLGEYMHLNGVILVAVYMGVGFLILQIIYHNANNLNEYIMRNQDIVNFPVNQIISINAFIMSVVTMLCGTILLVCYNQWLRQLLSKFVTKLGEVLKQLLQAFFSYEAGNATGQASSGQIDQSVLSDMQGGDGGILAIVFQIIGIALGISIAIVAVTGVVVGIVTLLARMIRSMDSTIENAVDVKEFVLPIGMEQQLLKRRERKSLIKVDGMSGQVRRIYQKMVLKSAKRRGAEVHGNMQPSEITQEYVASHQEEITAIYEKARYANESVTKEELEQMKEYRKGKQ